MVIIRLWHYKLIPVLPNAMLVSQWRECIAIKRQWEKGTLKHRLVSYVKDFPKILFRNYVLDIVDEMERRNIKYNDKLFDELLEFTNDMPLKAITFFINYPTHNDRYLKQCYYNLQEKYDRGIVSKEEWELIHKNIYGLIKEYLFKEKI